MNAQVHHRYATVDGHRLFYREAGPQDCPSYLNAWPESAGISNLVSFEPDKIEVWLDDHLEPGQTVVAHGVDRGLDSDEVLRSRARSAS